MMLFEKYIQQIRNLPPKLLLNEIALSLKKRLYKSIQRLQDRKRCTYTNPDFTLEGNLFQFLSAPTVDKLKPYADQITGVTDLYLKHHFNLLGSGWVRVRHGMACRGLEGIRFKAGKQVGADSKGNWLTGRINPPNLARSQSVWSLIDEAYVPIDWQIDFKSGFRWSEHTWFKDVDFGPDGADIKIPWELSRMQHLPQLPWAYALSAGGENYYKNARVYAREFRNQVLDFIATNPPRFGVNWYHAMDVAIRAANWLVAYDLFTAFGAEFDPPFKAIFQQSIYDHGRHILDNLEWNCYRRNNHYLANISGLIFIAAYLPITTEIDCWMAFAVQELLRETQAQFHGDGTNVEASTSYHRLSAEMVIYSVAVVLGLPKAKRQALLSYDHRLHTGTPRLFPAPLAHQAHEGLPHPVPFSPRFFEIIEKATEFVIHTTKPDGNVLQIGDDDGGRFFKLNPVFRKMTVMEARRLYENLYNYRELEDDALFWDENLLDHRHLVAAANAFVQRNDFCDFVRGDLRETESIRMFTADIKVPSYRYATIQNHGYELGTVRSKTAFYRMADSILKLSRASMRAKRFPYETGGLTSDLRLFAYPDFGLYIFCSRHLYLAVRCGKVDYDLKNGHAHNDQLSVELVMDGRPIVRDPGTYLYTALPQRRNQYRSVTAHFCPQFSNREPVDLTNGLFQMKASIDAQCLFFEKEGFIGCHRLYSDPVYRVIRVQDDFIDVADLVAGHRPLRNIYETDMEQPAPIPISPSYGMRYA